MKINVLEYLNEASDLFGDKIAFEDKNTSITFRNFRIKSQIISSLLSKELSEIKAPIGVLLPKSINALTAFMGILYSGNIYMPLDIKNPVNRLQDIIDNICPIALVTDKENESIINRLNYKGKIFFIESLLSEEVNVTSVTTHYKELIDTDGAYIINTSGSTGIPKGVLISHRSIIDYIDWASEEFHITSSEIIGNQSPFYFDNSVLDIYLTLKCGCKLVITPNELFLFPIKLLEYCIESNVNMIFFVPSLLVSIANMGLLDKIHPKFTKILFAGEVMPTKQLNYWIKNYPQAVFSNLYGPTEITVDCTFYTVNRNLKNDEPLPIGNKCRNSDVFVLKNNQLVTAPFEIGELCVRGSSLALGYYNNIEQTNKVFTQNPLNSKYPEKIYRTGDLVYYNDKNELIYKGRKDYQVKHLGYRIELGEIETKLGVIKEFDNVCAIYDNSLSKIVLFYVSNTEISKKDIYLKLQKILPNYMIPNIFIKIDKMPLNSNGKIDRKMLLKTMLNKQ